jgi:hypothetical protein
MCWYQMTYSNECWPCPGCMNKPFQFAATALSLDEPGWKHIDKSLMAASKAGRHENQKNSPVIPDSVFC